jgi:hypothetical protein
MLPGPMGFLLISRRWRARLADGPIQFFLPSRRTVDSQGSLGLGCKHVREEEAKAAKEQKGGGGGR